MKAESTVMPMSPFEIVFIGETAEVTLIENVREIPGTEDEPTKWEWDEYRLRVRNRAGLIEDIESGFAIWLQTAKDLDYKTAADAVREKRNALLKESDARVALDRLGLSIPSGSTFTAWLSFLKGLGEALMGEWAKYRQALRDLPEQPGFPYEVTFPKPPEEE